jgi:hypothetical protein
MRPDADRALQPPAAEATQPPRPVGPPPASVRPSSPERSLRVGDIGWLVSDNALHVDAGGESTLTILPAGVEVAVLADAGERVMVQASPGDVFGWLDGRAGLREPAAGDPPVCHGSFDVLTIALMHPQRRLECYGGHELRLEGYIVRANTAPTVPEGEPEWLAGPASYELASVVGPAADGGSLPVALAPGVSVDGFVSDREGVPGTRVVVSAHFDDAASIGCDLRPTSGPVLTRDLEVLLCRQRLVVGAVTLAAAVPGPPEYVKAATQSGDGIEVTLELSAERAAYPARTWGRVTVTNSGTDNVYWQAGGCGHVASIAARPAVSWTVDAGDAPTGELGVLKSVTMAVDGPIVPEFTPSEWVGAIGNFGCTTHWALGESAAFIGAWDHDGPHDMPAPAGRYAVEATFAYYGRGMEPPADVQNRLPDQYLTIVASHAYTVDAAPTIVGPGDAFDVITRDERVRNVLAEVGRDRWLGSNLRFYGGHWRLEVVVDDPPATLVAIANARTAEVVSVELRAHSGVPR